MFDTNIFYPLRHTLAYSDAVLLQGLTGAPLMWIGVPTVIVYNLLVFAGFVLSGVGAFLLVRDLTGSSAAGLIGGIVFTFAPFRFDHYVHLELLWAQWIPLTLWMLHRTLKSGRLRDGLWTGICIGLQGLSCVYYTVFLVTILAVAGPILLTTAAPHLRRRAVLSLLAGAVVAAIMLVPYIVAYQSARADIGERGRTVAMLGFSAGPKHYLATTPNNILYGAATAPISVHEKRLFMGFLVMALMVVGVWPPLNRTRVAYALALAIAVDVSFAQRGLLLGWLWDHVVIYRGLRVPARFGQIALLAAAVLAGFGVVRVLDWLRRRRPTLRRPVLAAIGSVVLLEYLMYPLALVPVSTKASESSVWLRSQPPAPIVNLPMPKDRDSTLDRVEFLYEFESTFHWRPMLNGYTGTHPTYYVLAKGAVEDFPSDAAVDKMREIGIVYAVVHERYYGRERYRDVTTAAQLRQDLGRVRPVCRRRVRDEDLSDPEVGTTGTMGTMGTTGTTGTGELKIKTMPHVSPRWEDPRTVAGFVSGTPNEVLLAYARRVLDAPGPRRCLDLGCGAARNAAPLAEMGFRVTGTDLSAPMIAGARDRVRAAAPSVTVHLIIAPMAPLPFPDATFDLVVAHGIWNLARSGAEFRAGVAEAARVSKPGAGLFLFTFSRHTLPPDARADAGETFVFSSWNGEPQCFLTEDEILAELGQAGFVRDAPGPLTEYNLPRPGELRSGGPVIYEGTFAKQPAAGVSPAPTGPAG